MFTVERKTDTAEVLVEADLVAEIKTTLSVSVTDLASIAGVSRQAIYDWIDGGQVSDANYERLLKLRQVCMDWRALTNRPIGCLLRMKSAEGTSLLDLLRQDPLDRSLIVPQLEALAEKAAEQNEQCQARNARLVPLSEKDQYENALTHAIPATPRGCASHPGQRSIKESPEGIGAEVPRGARER